MDVLSDPKMLLFAFLLISSVIGFLLLFFQKDEDSAEARLTQLSASPKTQEDDLFADFQEKSFVSAILPFLDTKVRQKMADRLVYAGIYRRDSTVSYLAIKTMLVVVPVGLAFFVYSSGLASMKASGLFALVTGIAGLIGPGFYLDAQRTRRQSDLRRAIPDALDIIIICVEGGLSISASFARVAAELSAVHPLLSMELTIVQREIQMGHSTGEAMRNFARRFDMEELRTLASVILQAEKFGSSIVRALRTHADGLREKRMMRAEELASQAAVKILLPTVFCIFPSLFVVILGPAAFDVMSMMSNLGKK
jgi:tight adherence protein C